MGTRPLRKPLRRIFFAVSRRRASTASSTSDAGTWTVTRRSIWEVVSTETCMDDPLTDLSVLGKREYKRAILRTQPQTGKLCVSVRALHFGLQDRKSTRLNSSHVAISYAVFCLKKKKNTQRERELR